jgi:phosphodiesterase/alkaline phosphatase D-like protein
MKRFLSVVVASASVALAVALASAPAAAGAAAPTVKTGAASGVTAAAATLGATVNANGQATTYTFQYGTTTSYGSQTATTSAGSSNSAQAVHVTVKGLASGTTYHFRVVATNATGTATGADATFKTVAVAPAVTLGSPSVVTSNTATLSGTVDPNSKATVYSFEYGPSTSYGLQTSSTSAGSGASASHVHATLSGLSSGTTYHYRLVATNADGTTASADGTLTTTGSATTPGGTLPVVSQASAVEITAHGAQLDGAINPGGPTTTWYFQYGLTSFYGMQTSSAHLSGAGARPVNARLGGLEAGQTYHYRLVAYSANGLYVGPDHTFTTQSGTRMRPRMLAVRASVRHEHGGIVLKLWGYLWAPASVARSHACTGAVAFQIRRGGAIVAFRRAFLRRNCHYRLTTHIRARRLRGTHRLRVLGRFEGNGSLAPTRARHTVRL